MDKMDALRKAKARANKLLRAEVYARALQRPIWKGTVLYESFSGNGMLCNPEAIFHYLASEPGFSHIRHIWVLSSLEEYATTVERFRGRSNVRFVEYKSTAYFAALARSEYLVNNATFPWEFSKRLEQTYVNTWHGTPLKRMGYDIEGGGPDTRNIVRNFLQADFLVAGNRRMKDMYLRAYKMSNIHRGMIFEGGYPRIDRQVSSASNQTEALASLSRAGLAANGRKVVLYAPTWKGSSFYSPENDIESLLVFAEELEQSLGSHKYKVLLKVHQSIYRNACSNDGVSGRLVPNEIPTNLVLGIADILITDYSSIYFDFLATGRSVFFYTPDADDYADTRGWYDQPSVLPGPVSNTINELSDQIRRIGAEPQTDTAFSVKYNRARREFVDQDDGAATERLVEAVFRGARKNTSIEHHNDGRESILIYLGGMSSNGITSSVLNLLNHIDYERFDVTAFYSFAKNRDRAQNAGLINDKVRLLPRQGGLNVTYLERKRYKLQIDNGIPPGHDYRAAKDGIWDLEWRRCFGDSQFDYVVDFSGYGPFWDLILLRGEARTHSIWLHNDLMSDSRRNVNGSLTMKKHLESVFTTYASFDRLVSVSPSLSAINRRNLHTFSDRAEFRSAKNTIDATRIRGMATDDSVETGSAVEKSLVSTHLSGFLEQLIDSYGATVVLESASRQASLKKFFGFEQRADTRVFVSVGRMSPEKNHARLIRAFAQLHEKYPNTRLLLIGNGPLLGELRSLAASLGVSRYVAFAGHQSNPYLLMKHSDCFVLSSDYEGQPMVILEAKVLGLPIISTAFDSIGSALSEDEGLIVPRRIEALAEGMEVYLQGGVPQKEFDAYEYNASAMDEFYEAIGASDGRKDN